MSTSPGSNRGATSIPLTLPLTVVATTRSGAISHCCASSVLAHSSLAETDESLPKWSPVPPPAAGFGPLTVPPDEIARVPHASASRACRLRQVHGEPATDAAVSFLKLTPPLTASTYSEAIAAISPVVPAVPPHFTTPRR